MYWRVPKGSPSHILQFGEHNLFEAPPWSPAMYTLLFNWSIALTTHDTSSHQDVEFDKNEFLQLIPMCAMKSTSWCSKAWHIYEWAQKYKGKFWETNKLTSLPHIWSQTPSVPFVAVAGLFIISKKNSLIPIGGPKTCAHKCQCKIAHEKTCFFLWSLASLETNTTHVCSLSMWQTSVKFERLMEMARHNVYIVWDDP